MVDLFIYGDDREGQIRQLHSPPRASHRIASPTSSGCRAVEQSRSPSPPQRAASCRAERSYLSSAAATGAARRPPPTSSSSPPSSIASSCRGREGGCAANRRGTTASWSESSPTASAASWWIPSEAQISKQDLNRNLRVGELMYGSPVSKDLNLPVQPPPMTSSGLLRYRSAPSSVLGDLCEDLLPPASGNAGPPRDADNVFSRFLADHHHIRDDKPPSQPQPAHFPSAADMASQHQQMMFHSQSQQQQQMVDAANKSGGGLYRTVSSGMEAAAAAGTNTGVGHVGSNLLRQSSSPAGFLDHFSMDNGYGAMLRASMGMAGAGGAATDGGGGRLKGQLSFSSRQGSLMSQISEMDSEEVGGSSPEAGRGGYIPGYPMSSAGWDVDSSSALMSDSLSGMKRPRDSSEQQQNGGGGGGLAHQFSLPKTSSEMAAIEKFLQFQDAVPCKIRAKRGCATHPRSIAERVRRTKISERIRKLQELVPNMDKQTNTSDMLDLAVDYIKELQKEVKALNESRASCTCPASKHQHFSS